MNIVFSDTSSIRINLADTPMLEVVRSFYKHLQHVPVPFKDWDNPYFYNGVGYSTLVDKLKSLGQAVGATVDAGLCLKNDQGYFNSIHKIYETNYDGNPDWLSFHEHIHICERYFLENKKTFLSIDYREKSGLLEKKFNPEWIEYASPKLSPGDVFLYWSELGKTPYMYWDDGEPNDLDRMCELAKPWIILRPKMCVALEDIDFMPTERKVDAFNEWWKDYEQPWCQHWGITSWSLEDQHSVVVIGRIEDYDRLESNLKHNLSITKVTL